jgi:hypothetical protein
MVSMVRGVKVALLLVLFLFTISFVMGVGSADTGPAEKVVLIALIVGCVVLAARIPGWVDGMAHRMRGTRTKI